MICGALGACARFECAALFLREPERSLVRDLVRPSSGLGANSAGLKPRRSSTPAWKPRSTVEAILCTHLARCAFDELTPEERAVYATLKPEGLPQHVAIIMDGNGRWAGRRSLKRFLGHQQGAKSVQLVTETASRIGLALAHALRLFAGKQPAPARAPKSASSCACSRATSRATCSA